MDFSAILFIPGKGFMVDNEEEGMTVHKVKGGYKVKSSTRGWLSKKPLTKEEALAQHRAIMMEKAKKAKAKKKKK